ncbi:MAG: type II secretion system protein [Lachnospiraceae bacterium]|nr:type II secretion system protein [Lachnospiraceae bacterium]
MLIKEKKNKGFTLVEVIVSMLVLSITITSVLLAFNLAAKANSKTKKMQTAESLLGDLVEYTEAYAKDMDTTKAMTDLVVGGEMIYSSTFMCVCTVETAFSDTNDVEVSKLTGITEGVHTYDVRITRDRKPAEYVGQDVSKAITFGETGSKTVLINANVSTYDTAYLSYFLSQHSTAVDQHNDNEEALAAADPTYVKDEKSKLTEAEMQGKISRELRFELVHPDGNTEKVQLVGYVDYKLDSSVFMPAGAAYEMSDSFYTSDEYDSLTTTDTTPQHLKQIYILYTPTTFTKVAAADIRLLDMTNTVPGSAGGSLDANIFLVYQKNTPFSVADAASKVLSEYYAATENINVSFSGAGFGGVIGTKIPTRADIYCSAKATLTETATNVAEPKNYELIATSENARIISINIEVLDHETGQVLTKTSEPITCLQ